MRFVFVDDAAEALGHALEPAAAETRPAAR
jgi:hypothetical protein